MTDTGAHIGGGRLVSAPQPARGPLSPRAWHLQAPEHEPIGLVPIMNSRQRLEFLATAAVWLAGLAWFWSWWLDPAHIIGWPQYIANTVVMAWLTLMPGYCVFLVARARVPDPALQFPPGRRVAMVVTKAPSEPFDVVQRTLEAMLGQTYACDVWLADEDPSQETLAWCSSHGVQVSTRKGRADYHRANWPRRTRCKEGNLAYFYDHYGYEGYEFVAQLDADHVPTPTYLAEILKPFVDPRIGYVSAPSICDSNAAESWSARSRLYCEALFHGLIQCGHSNRLAPMCIGSHYAVRTAALKDIGGLGPELAEDHSTSLLMNAHGWRGVHAIQAIAHGDGPRTYADMAVQEFQWSRSLAMVLLQFTPKLFRGLPPRMKAQFLFAQLWYPLSLLMAIGMLIPIIALVFDTNMVDVAYADFLLHVAPPALALVFMVSRWTSFGWARPSSTRVISWEGAIYLLIRWPWAIWGVTCAVRDWWTNTTVDFRVTPKGADATAPLPPKALAPTMAISIISILPVVLCGAVHASSGFYMLAIINAAAYAAVSVVIVVMHRRETGATSYLPATAPATRRMLGLTLAAMLMLPALGTVLRGQVGLTGLMSGSDVAVARLLGWTVSDVLDDGEPPYVPPHFDEPANTVPDRSELKDRAQDH